MLCVYGFVFPHIGGIVMYIYMALTFLMLTLRFVSAESVRWVWSHVLVCFDRAVCMFPRRVLCSIKLDNALQVLHPPNHSWKSCRDWPKIWRWQQLDTATQKFAELQTANFKLKSFEVSFEIHVSHLCLWGTAWCRLRRSSSHFAEAPAMTWSVEMARDANRK